MEIKIKGKMVFLTGKVIISPKILLVLILLVAAGYVVVYVIANRRWGYTKEREKELDNNGGERKVDR